LVTKNGSLTPICSLSKLSLLPSLTVQSPDAYLVLSYLIANVQSGSLQLLPKYFDFSYSQQQKNLKPVERQDLMQEYTGCLRVN